MNDEPICSLRTSIKNAPANTKITVKYDVQPFALRLSDAGIACANRSVLSFVTSSILSLRFLKQIDYALESVVERGVIAVRFSGNDKVMALTVFCGFDTGPLASV